MPQLAIYLDEETAKELDEAAERDGKSRSEWVREAIKQKLSDRLPDSFFAVLGTWEDERSTEEILADLRSGPEQREREPLR